MSECPCYTCVAQRIDPRTGWSLAASTFVVCPECGNKRCPRATHHDQACTGSNEPGQKGSRYE